VSKCTRIRARGWNMKRGQRQRERWSARVAIMAGLQRGRRNRREEEEKYLAKIHLNFEKFKIWSK
jgi:hypothetical protein